VRAGDAAPGAPGAAFERFNYSSILNELGQTAFFGVLTGGGVTAADDQGIWIQRGTGLELLLREGSQAPGVAAGGVFDFGFEFGSQTSPSLFLNDPGRVVLFSSLRRGSGGVTNTNDLGIWAEDLAGVLRLIVREGDMLEVTPGDFRTVSRLRFNNNLGFNAAGEVAFAATFTDNTEGVFVSRAATVPEPRSLSLALTGALAAVVAVARMSLRPSAMRN
jgi:hypothetical protein